MRSSGRTWHLIYLAHLWLLSPFLFLWIAKPNVARQLSESNMAAMRIFSFGVIAYIAIRTFFAWKNPKWLNWEYVFPPIDVLLITCMLYLGDRDPLGNITIMYFLPIAEAAGTLNVVWAASVGVMCVTGCMIASFGVSAEPAYNIAFRLAFLLISASLFTFLARIAAQLKSQLDILRDRNRLALEMHDGVQAHLIAASAQMELLQHITDGQARQIAGDTRGSLRSAADELRFLVQRMRAPALGQGFWPALQHYAHNFCERCGLQLEMRSEIDSPVLDAEQENALFRIAQEALTNIAKHAKATRVMIHLSQSEKLSFSIEDDGAGTDDLKPGIGLEGMQRRAHEVGGFVEIASDKEGTRVTVELPLAR